MTEELHEMKSVGTYIANLATNSSASLMDYPDMLYDIAAARGRRSSYINAGSGRKETAAYTARAYQAERRAAAPFNNGVNIGDFTVDLSLEPGSCFGPNPDKYRMGTYLRWDPNNITFLPLSGETVQGFMGCENFRTYNFSLVSPRAPTAGPVTSVATAGVLHTAGIVNYLQVRTEPALTVNGGCRFLWGANQNVSVAIDPETTLPSAAFAVNCTNIHVQTTARYILKTYGSFNVTQDTSLRIEYPGGYILANTRMIDDDRGLRILLVVDGKKRHRHHCGHGRGHVSVGHWDVVLGHAAAVEIYYNYEAGIVTVPVTGGGREGWTASLLAGHYNVLTHPPTPNTAHSTWGQATNFDFNALESGYMEERSFVREISNMQDVFRNMLGKFANAIQVNHPHDAPIALCLT
ncbi:hypothetical protein BDK51DRAFT_38193 [Blyttiomyces helicus]|uniref:Uncharacterized protein n=1 Tax=Blyttiomyces helicus TaxID=388810 RepID=A0A4P9W645_9FUNG|nr:hypothetical protein BDK51DRAFT_38193 [Blyttiomyces helicus]|eukprot:RKO86815.1 hypothetical protein BDK51DRAFT_38193 [Blyttiomyces helicus]